MNKVSQRGKNADNNVEQADDDVIDWKEVASNAVPFLTLQRLRQEVQEEYRSTMVDKAIEKVCIFGGGEGGIFSNLLE